jgi:nicotinate phosphoribosyltransferase
MFHVADSKDTKDGKMAGSKTVFRCSKCLQDKMVPFMKGSNRVAKGSSRCSCGGRTKEFLLPFIQNNEMRWSLPKPQKIREYVLKQLPHFDL